MKIILALISFSLVSAAAHADHYSCRSEKDVSRGMILNFGDNAESVDVSWSVAPRGQPQIGKLIYKTDTDDGDLQFQGKIFFMEVKLVVERTLLTDDQGVATLNGEKYQCGYVKTP